MKYVPNVNSARLFFFFFFIGISLVNAIVDSGICAWVVQMVNHLNTFLFFPHP